MSLVDKALRNKVLRRTYSGRIGTQLFSDDTSSIILKTFPESERYTFEQAKFMETCIIPRYDPIFTDDLRIAFPHSKYQFREVSRRDRKLFFDYAQQLFTMYSRGYFHWDIKPENLVIDEDGHGIIIDIEVNSVFKASPSAGGSYWYYPPEIVLNGSTDFETLRTLDVYSLAMSFICANLNIQALWGSYSRMFALEDTGLTRSQAVRRLYLEFTDGKTWKPNFYRMVKQASQGDLEFERILLECTRIKDRPTWLELLGNKGFSSEPWLLNQDKYEDDPPDSLNELFEILPECNPSICVFFTTLQLHWKTNAPLSSCLKFSQTLNHDFLPCNPFEESPEGDKYLQDEVCSATGAYQFLHLSCLGCNPFSPVSVQWSKNNLRSSDYFRDIEQIETNDQTKLFLKTIVLLVGRLGDFIPDTQDGKTILHLVLDDHDCQIRNRTWLEQIRSLL